jgi:hypothetical protein
MTAAHTTEIPGEFPAAAARATDLWFAWSQVDFAARAIAARSTTDLRGPELAGAVCVRVRGTSPIGPVNYVMGLYRPEDAVRAAAQIAYALNGQWVHVHDRAGGGVRVEALWPDAPWRPEAPPVPLRATSVHDWWIGRR